MRKINDNSLRMLEEFCSAINSGALPCGSALPSENELCIRYKISRPTVRRVLDKLVGMHLVEKRPGIGSFVTELSHSDDNYMFTPFNVGLVSPPPFNLASHYSAMIVDGINNSPYGKSFYLKPIPVTQDKKLLAGIDVDGFLLPGSAVDYSALISDKRPSVICNAPSPGGKIGSVRVDNRLEARRAMEYLFKYGYRRIAIIGGKLEVPGSSKQRLLGCMDAYREAGIPFPAELHLPDLIKGVLSDETLRQFISTQNFDAAFFVNASRFIWFIPYYNLLSGRTIKDLHCMVFDNITPFKELVDVPCCYIKMPLDKFGSTAIEYLRRKSHDDSYPVLDKVFNCEMIIRY